MVNENTNDLPFCKSIDIGSSNGGDFFSSETYSDYVFMVFYDEGYI